MRRVAVVFTALAVLFTAGCFTHRDKVAYRRAELVLKDRGTKGDELAAAVGSEVAEANLDTGASEVAESEVELTPAAAAENAEGIRKARAGRGAILGYVKAGWNWAVGEWPWLAILGGFGAGAWKLYQKLAAYRKGLETVVEGVGGATTSKDPVRTAIRNLAIDYGIQPFLDKVVQAIDPKG